MDKRHSNSNKIAAMYGYSNNRYYSGFKKGDEVTIYNTLGIPILEDSVEDISREAIKVGGQWWYDFEYTVRKLND